MRRRPVEETALEDLELTTTYFAEPGPQNTETTLALAAEHARRQSIEYVVIASDTGKTARRAIEVLGGERKLVVVTNPANLRFPVAKLHDYLPRFKQHKQGLLDAGIQHIPCSLDGDVLAELEAAGATVHRIDWKRFQSFTRVGLSAVDRVGVGVRVGLTVAIWACLSRAFPPGVDVVAVAGTGFGGGGADTAVVVRTAKVFKDFRVLELLCKPRVGPPSEM